MTDRTPDPPGVDPRAVLPAGPVPSDDPAQHRRAVRHIVVRIVASTALLLVLYYLLPLDGVSDWGAAGTLVVGLAALGGALAIQVRQILRADQPVLRAYQALGLALPVLIVVFAATYGALSYNQPESFSEPLDRTDALYLAITTLATVGYGDIAPITTTARVVAMLHMVLNLLFLGALGRAFLLAARHAERTRHPGPT